MTRLTFWHDGGCPLCRREIALMRRLDREHRIDFINARSATICPRNRTELLSRFHACENGQMLEGAAAFAAMWRAIPVLRLLGHAARNPRVLASMERAYGSFLRIRPIMQRAARRLERSAMNETHAVRTQTRCNQVILTKPSLAA